MTWVHLALVVTLGAAGGAAPACTAVAGLDGVKLECTTSADCAIGNGTSCVARSCNDGRCQPVASGSGACVDGHACGGDGDCASGVCDATQSPPVCVSCGDHARNGLETDVDCGGPRCAPCPDQKQCAVNADCASGLCSTTASPPVCGGCADGLENGTETDVDCGGQICARCTKGAKCLVGSDCSSGVCTMGACG